MWQHRAVLKPTGERQLMDEANVATLIHVHRYAFALPFCRDREVLDCASGEGYGSHQLASAARHVVGVDVSRDAVLHARAAYRAPNLAFLAGSADGLPLRSASRDVVVSFETIEHTLRQEPMADELRRVLRPGGLLILSTPDRKYWSDAGVRNPYHVRELYADELRAILAKRFAHVRMLVQQAMSGSVIAPCEEGAGIEVKLETPTLNLAIASDAPLPPIRASVLGGPDLERVHMDLDGRIREQEEVIRSLRRSRAYRLGRALTWPIRKLLGRE